MRKLLYILLASLFLFACTSTKSDEVPEEMEDILASIDTMSFENMKLEIKNAAEQLDAMSGILKMIYSKDDKPEKVAEEDVSTEEEKVFDLVPLDMDLFGLITFIQHIDYPNSVLELDRSELSFPDWYKVDVWIDSVYFSDGTVDTTSVYLDRRAKIKSAKQIDSISVELRLRYPNRVLPYTISSSQKSMKKDSLEVRLQKVEHNFARIVMPYNITKYYVDMQAKDKEGRYLRYSSSSSGAFPPEQQLDFYKKFISGMNKLSREIDDDKYKTKEELKNAIVNYVKTLDYKKPEEYFQQKYYKGNVEEVIVYFADGLVRENYFFTLKRKETDKTTVALAKGKNGKYGFVDASGNFIIQPTLPENIVPVNEYFYTCSDYYNDYLYRIDIENHVAEKIDGYDGDDCEALNETMIIVGRNGYKGVMDKTGKLVVPLVYDEIRFDPDNTDSIEAIKEDGTRTKIDLQK